VLGFNSSKESSSLHSTVNDAQADFLFSKESSIVHAIKAVHAGSDSACLSCSSAKLKSVLVLGLSSGSGEMWLGGALGSQARGLTFECM